ncbi:hypothetical protein NE686_17620 [Tissierella carlieri]|uniref:Uncharacterized protein n=1 Tax=Tissierella carlieri TaxID=689904 RepID=A0ABT1SEN3_9FIRM|nr:hypothetical protein [Tissierella carlieri]MCQ4924925.1 hypothetical protein [Tissierella carlieri]
MTRNLTNLNIGDLSKESLKETLTELRGLTKEFCTVQIAKQNGESYVYGIWENNMEFIEDYKKSGGVWSYNTPDHYITLIEKHLHYLELSE